MTRCRAFACGPTTPTEARTRLPTELAPRRTVQARQARAIVKVIATAAQNMETLVMIPIMIGCRVSGYTVMA
jgi:hypothetical protein